MNLIIYKDIFATKSHLRVFYIYFKIIYATKLQIGGYILKKIVFCSLICTSILTANSNVYVNAGKKEYKNSKTKIDGTTYTVGTTHNYENSTIQLNFSQDSVERKNPVTKQAIDTLHVKKYNANYKYNFNEQLSLKTSYIKILDNLAPTDQGKIYGVGGIYNINKGLGVALDYYKSDYEKFDVNQYDLSVFKGFRIGETKLKATVIAKAIDIDGDKYGNYTFQDKNYFTTGVKLGMNYQGYVAGIGAFFGKRMFTVMDGGNKVQHHAMEQDKTYMLSFGKKFKNFDIIAKYSYQNGKELPENQDDVDTKVTSLMLKYKF